MGLTLEVDAEFLFKKRFGVDGIVAEDRRSSELVVKVVDVIAEEREHKPIVHRWEHLIARTLRMALAIGFTLSAIHLDHVRVSLELCDAFATRCKRTAHATKATLNVKRPVFVIV